MLCELARGSARSAAISPETEASVFSRIEAIAGKAVREKPVIVFSRRTLVAAAVALMLLSASLGYFAPKIFSSGNSATVSQPASPVVTAEKNFSDLKDLSGTMNSVSSSFRHPAFGNRRLVSETANTSHVTDASLNQKYETNETNRTYQTPGNNDESLASNTLTPAAARTEDIAISEGAQRHSPFDRRDEFTGSHDLLEASPQTSNGF